MEGKVERKGKVGSGTVSDVTGGVGVEGGAGGRLMVSDHVLRA